MTQKKFTTILIRVPQAEKIVKEWRKKYDDNSPAHISLLFPFKKSEFINEEITTKLTELFSKVEPFPFTLEKINTFPNAIFLEPTNKNIFIELTQKLVEIFPENPPYEGKYPSIIPHLTIGQFNESQDQGKIKAEIEEDLKDKLPIHALANEAWVMEDDNNNWSTIARFPFMTATIT
jgi:2'-5' RNA ligase